MSEVGTDRPSPTPVGGLESDITLERALAPPTADRDTKGRGGGCAAKPRCRSECGCHGSVSIPLREEGLGDGGALELEIRIDFPGLRDFDGRD